jgi:hypothetical protein
MYDPKKHAELNQRIDAAVKKFEETRAKADQVIAKQGTNEEAQQAVLVEAAKAAKAAGQAADELATYLSSVGAKAE